MTITHFLSQGRRSKKLSDEIKTVLPSINNIKIISGFLTREGFEKIFGPDEKNIKDNGKKIEYIVVGRLTVECAEIFDELYLMPEYKNKLFINLGLGRLNKSHTAINRFLPMIHSKIIALNPSLDDNLFYIGSANITHFAIEDFNAEAGIILKNIDSSERTGITRYMDNLKNLKSTVPYDPSLKDSLNFLSNLSADPLEKDVENIDSCLLVLCLSPTDYKPKKGDVLFADLPKHLPEEVIKFHQKTKRYLILMLFKSLSDLLNMSFRNAIVVYASTESINDIQQVNRSIETNINGMIYYDPTVPPIIIPMNTAPSANPVNFHSQMKCKVISYIDVPEKIFDLFNFQQEKETKVNDLVVRKRNKPIQHFDIDDHNTVSFSDGLYGELLSFKRIGELSTLSEVKQEISKVQLDIADMDIITYNSQFNMMLKDLPSDDFHSELLKRYTTLLRKAFDQLKLLEKKEFHNFIFQFSGILKKDADLDE